MLAYSALVDASTAALLMLSARIPIIAFLAKTMPETEHWYYVNYPNYVRKFELAFAHADRLPEWAWNPKQRIFRPLARELITDELRTRSRLAMKKSYALSVLITEINAARNPVANGLAMQETVYITKKMQAQRYKDAGCPDDDLLAYPYVLQYADYSGLTMEQAADEIAFKAKLDDELLLKSEYFRLKYFNLLKDITEEASVDKLVVDFKREFFKPMA